MLTKRQENLIRSLFTRHGRKGSDLCVCDGLRSGGEILALRPDLVERVFLRKGTRLPFPLPEKTEILEEKEFDSIADTVVNSQGLIVVAKRPEKTPDSAPLAGDFALVLDGIRDPGNMGTILRTARACALKEVFLTKGSADAFSDKCIRSASGAQFALKIRECGDLSETAELLRAKGVRLFYRTLPDAEKTIFSERELFAKSAVILGSEGSGVSELAGARDVAIPMPGDAESLNVAQAATVILFEHVRRTHPEGHP